MYRFSYRCRENLSLEMGDLTENIFLNATAADKATDKELAAFLSYVNGKAAESSFTKNLDNEVKRIRDSRRSFMNGLGKEMRNIRLPEIC